jgi:hypothetical protein
MAQTPVIISASRSKYIPTFYSYLMIKLFSNDKKLLDL